jgi:hypothetical protein
MLLHQNVRNPVSKELLNPQFIEDNVLDALPFIIIDI